MCARRALLLFLRELAVYVPKYLLRLDVHLVKWDGTSYEPMTSVSIVSRDLSEHAGEANEWIDWEIVAAGVLTAARDELLTAATGTLSALSWCQPELPF